MNILLTGATGFIGSHVASEILKNVNCTIIAPVRKQDSYKNTDFLSKQGIILKQGCYFEKDFIDSIFEEHRIDYVLHIAALRGAGKGTFDDYQAMNVDATENLLACAHHKRVKRFIFCSSVGVWGTIPKIVPPDKTTTYVGDNLYHQSKIEAEKRVNRYIQKGLDAVIVRPTITYGEGDDGFPATLVKLIRTRAFILPREEVRIHLVSINKLAELFILLIKQNGMNHNVLLGLDKRPISLKRIADVIYNHFYGIPYPKYMQLPKVIFNLGIFICKMTRNDVWTARLKLISKDWYFSTNSLEKELHFQAGDTEVEFGKYLRSAWLY